MIYTARQFLVKGDKETNKAVMEAMASGAEYQIKQIKLLKDIQEKIKLKKDTKLQIKLAEEMLMKEYKWQEKMMSLNIPYWFRRMSAERIGEKEHELNKLTLRNSFETGTREGISAESINHAKNVSILDLLEFNKGIVKCLWHKEKSGSMKYYPKTNSIYCFGCGKSADSIDIYMKLNECDFKTAIIKLNQ